jgi:hypothetical protein
VLSAIAETDNMLTVANLQLFMIGIGKENLEATTMRNTLQNLKL